jgi:hypothetical protein
MMSFTTDDVGRRFKAAANRAADAIQVGTDPYDAAAYGGPGKAAFPGYAAQVASVIYTDGRITNLYNQGLNQHTPNTFQVRPWLNAPGTFWVHCFSNNMPNQAPYRVYVCTRLDQTHSVLRQLLQGYNGSLKFKVAAHDEAQRRNDTIVSWHANLQEARLWADIARANAGLLEGEAPAGTFGGLDTYAVGIDTEVQGDTSTSRVARAAQAEAGKRQLKNPYL